MGLVILSITTSMNSLPSSLFIQEARTALKSETKIGKLTTPQDRSTNTSFFINDGPSIVSFAHRDTTFYNTPSSEGGGGGMQIAVRRH